MRHCSKCGLAVLSEGIRSCVVCGDPLVEESSDTNGQDDAIAVQLDFAILACDQCGGLVNYGQAECPACGSPTGVDHSGTPVADAADPKVVARRRALLGLTSEVAALQARLARTAGSVAGATALSDEASYLQQNADITREYSTHTDDIRYLLTQMRFAEETIGSDEFGGQLMRLTELYRDLARVIEQAVTLPPPPSWLSWHNMWTSALLEGYTIYAGVTSVLTAATPQHAAALMADFTAHSGLIARKLQAQHLVFGGKRLRYGDAADVAETIAVMAADGVKVQSLRDLGWDYFSSVFVRDTDQIPRENGFVLAIWAIVAEACEEPARIVHRSERLASLVRRGLAANREAFLAVAGKVESDIQHAAEMVLNVGITLTATDMGRLGPTHACDIWIHCYQRLSEGAFKSLLNVVLLCEGLISGSVDDYEQLSVEGFSRKVKRLAKSSDPMIAGLADDLVMYLRHADAHCDFSTAGDGVVVNERDSGTRALIRTHTYDHPTLAALCQRLFEGVFAILVGVRCLQIEQHELFPALQAAHASDLDVAELVRLLFATQGLLVERLDPRLVQEPKPEPALVARPTTGVELTPERLLTAMASVSHLLPDKRIFTLRLCDRAGEQLGTVKVPLRKLQQRLEPGRVTELRLLELRFSALTKCCQPVDLLWRQGMTADSLYLWEFLRPLAFYLSNIMCDCFGVVRDQVDDSETVNTLHREALVLQNVLTIHQPPEDVRTHHAMVRQAIGMVIEGLRDCQLAGRRGGSGSKEGLKIALGRAMLPATAVLEYISSIERAGGV